MLATVNTDAGYYVHYSLGSFAYWIKTDTVRILNDGILKGPISSSLEAEIKSIGNALSHLFSEKGIPNVSRVVLNTDCIPAIIAIRHGLTRVPRNKSQEAAKMVADMIARVAVPVEFRHVKGHVYGKENEFANSSRHYVNHWCDERCAQNLREAVAELDDAARRRARTKFYNKYKKRKK